MKFFRRRKVIKLAETDAALHMTEGGIMSLELPKYEDDGEANVPVNGFVISMFAALIAACGREDPEAKEVYQVVLNWFNNAVNKGR